MKKTGLRAVDSNWTMEKHRAEGRLPEHEPTEVGKEIVKAREFQGWSQTELANRIMKSRSLVNQYETGKIKEPGTDVLQKIADVTHYSIDKFLRTSEVAKILSGGKMNNLSPEGELVDIKKIKPGDAEILQSIIGKQKAEVWRLTSDSCNQKHLKGSYLIVVDRPRKSGDIVLVRISGVPVFRKYLPPWLNMATTEPQPAALAEDDSRLTFGGVVLPISISPT